MGGVSRGAAPRHRRLSRRARQDRARSNGKRARPCSPKTIKTRRAELVAVARMAVRIGHSHRKPDLARSSGSPRRGRAGPRSLLEEEWRGAEGLHHRSRLEAARAWRGRSGWIEAAIERLDDIRASLEEYRHGGLTGKNLALIRQVLTEGIWSEVVSLPNVLMRQARADQAHAPVKAAVTAQLAVAIAILSFAPVRLANLVSIELGKNLIKPGGPNSPFWLVFPHYDVKNRVNLEFTFDEGSHRADR